MKTTSKILAFFLAITLCVGFIPMFASAATKPELSLKAEAPSDSKTSIIVYVSVNSVYLTSTQLNVLYNTSKLTFVKGEPVNGYSYDISNCINNTAQGSVAINFASVNTACSNKNFYKLYFTAKNGATGVCEFKLNAKNVYIATAENGNGVKTSAVTLTGVSINIPSVASIDTPKYPAVRYNPGQITALDLTKFSVSAEYNNGYKETISINDCTYAYYKKDAKGAFNKVNFNGKTIGDYKFIIYYAGKNHELYFSIQDPSTVVKSVKIATLPTKLKYIANTGAEIDLSGLVLSVTAQDNKVSTVSVNAATKGLSVNGYKNDKKGSQTITVTYNGTDTKFTVFVGNIAGDVDGNGQVTAGDARSALRCTVKLETFDEVQKEAADVNKDNEISSADARSILRCSVKLETLS